MSQLYVEQVSDVLVNDVQPLDADAFTFLDPQRTTTVTEITCETIGGVLSGGSGLALGVPGNAFAEVRLYFHEERRREDFYAPSHVPSPPFSDAIGARLRVTLAGYNGSTYSLARAVGAHAYFEEA